MVKQASLICQPRVLTAGRKLDFPPRYRRGGADATSERPDVELQLQRIGCVSSKVYLVSIQRILRRLDSGYGVLWDTIEFKSPLSTYGAAQPGP